ncbi:MAG: hypothetical protein H7338_04180, partial [Candidatus Sericytochromatia bacterium]|nr:hypothetical protein [Candidatus Sericytochromatia bacterium]
MSGRIVFAGVMPHGAELLPAEGLLDATADTPLLLACKALGAAVAETKPDVIIWIDPHAPSTRQAMGLFSSPLLRGDLAAFGRPHVDLELRTDLQLSQIILGLAKE